MRKGPMDCPSCLDELATPIVADASVVINLIASGFAATILGPLGSPLRVPGEVQAEIESGRSQGRENADKLARLIAGGQVAIVDLGATGISHFASLVTGAAQHTLDDGEATAIAYALEHGATVLIDEKKATRLCAERFGHLRVGSTVDLVGCMAVQAQILPMPSSTCCLLPKCECCRNIWIGSWSKSAPIVQHSARRCRPNIETGAGGDSPACRHIPQHCRAVGPVPHHRRHLRSALALAAPASGRFPRNAKVSIV